MMSDTPSEMLKFEFMLGNWDLEYEYSGGSGSATGTLRRALGGRYVFFDYGGVLSTGEETGAHAVFAWDKSIGAYRYWWFEDSGQFACATCKFVNDDTLALNWHDSLLTQEFVKDGHDRMILRMKRPDSTGEVKTVLTVYFARKST
jgi:hypothetical protein